MHIASKVLDPILSRCLAVRVAAPSIDQVRDEWQGHPSRNSDITSLSSSSPPPAPPLSLVSSWLGLGICDALCMHGAHAHTDTHTTHLPALTPQICHVLQYVAKKEHISLPPELATRIATQSGRNLRRAVLMMETCKVEQ